MFSRALDVISDLSPPEFHGFLELGAVTGVPGQQGGTHVVVPFHVILHEGAEDGDLVAEVVNVHFRGELVDQLLQAGPDAQVAVTSDFEARALDLGDTAVELAVTLARMVGAFPCWVPCRPG